MLSTGLCAASFCASAHALEHVELRNGFSVDCVRHEPIGDQVRLYFDANKSAYQDIPSSAIAQIQVLPDPPPPPAVTAVAAASPLQFGEAELSELIAKAGAARNLDVDLLASVIHTESGGRANAVSRTGARGLMQLMPGTARDLGVEDAFRPDQNINGGAAYLDSLLKLYNDDLKLALAAYNAGPAAVAKYHGIPPYRETRMYVSQVIREFIRRKQALKTTTVASR